MSDRGEAGRFAPRKAASVPAEVVVAAKRTTRQVLIGPEEAPHFALRRFRIEPGGGMPPHTNTVEHEQYVLGGRARIGLDDEVVEVSKDDVLFIPAGTAHWYETLGDEPFEFLCVVPNRPDRIRLL
ncbi:MAG: cupin domain-containing protein [Gemmatimonadota bacterium]|nr:MAG: cupin domain-containing protein [Gemmatimonadota bacterium]